MGHRSKREVTKRRCQKCLCSWFHFKGERSHCPCGCKNHTRDVMGKPGHVR